MEGLKTQLKQFSCDKCLYIQIHGVKSVPYTIQFTVRRFTEITGITEITTEITEITSNIILWGPICGYFSNIKSCTVDVRY